MKMITAPSPWPKRSQQLLSMLPRPQQLHPNLRQVFKHGSLRGRVSLAPCKSFASAVACLTDAVHGPFSARTAVEEFYKKHNPGLLMLLCTLIPHPPSSHRTLILPGFDPHLISKHLKLNEGKEKAYFCKLQQKYGEEVLVSESLLEAISIRDGARDPAADGTSPVFQPSLAAGMFKSSAEKARMRGEDPNAAGRDPAAELERLKSSGGGSGVSVNACSLPSARPSTTLGLRPPGSSSGSGKVLPTGKSPRGMRKSPSAGPIRKGKPGASSIGAFQQGSKASIDTVCEACLCQICPYMVIISVYVINHLFVGRRRSVCDATALLVPVPSRCV